MACIVVIPVVGENAAVGFHLFEQGRARIWCKDMEGCGRNSLIQRPVNGSLKHFRIITIQSENEAAVYHDAQIIQAADSLTVAQARIPEFPALTQTIRIQRLETDEQASKPGFCRAFNEIALQYGIHCGSPLKQTIHTPHAVEQTAGELLIAKEMVVQKVQMPAGQTFDFSQRIIHTLGVKGFASLEKGIFITKPAVMWTTACYDNRVGYQIAGTLN